MVDFVLYAQLERYLFGEVHRRFHSEHSIGAFDLFSIVIWKANRAKSRIARRLLAREGALDRAARQLSMALWRAPSPEARLRLLMVDWGLRLPMASAILTVLWPEEFTVYDERVCGELGDFSWLAHRAATRVWSGYCAYRTAVQQSAPAGLSLRDKDRFFWGRSAARQLDQDLKSLFSSRQGAANHRPATRKRGRRAKS